MHPATFAPMQDVRISIRRALPEDIDECLALDAACIGCDAEPPEVNDGVAWWIASADGVSVGYAAARRSWAFPLDTMYLARAGVLPCARGLRLQLRLIRARERWARAQGWTWSITDTASDNVRSMATLIRAGYRPYIPANPWTLGVGSTFWRRPLTG